MYGYTPDIRLTRDEIFKRVSQEEIYKLVLGYEPEEFKWIVSPLRTNDKNAGAWFEYYEGVLYFKDFGDSERQVRDSVQMIMDYHGLDFHNTLRYINDTLEIGIGTINPKPIIDEEIIQGSQRKFPYKYKERSRDKTEILIKAREFELRDKYYWYDRYNITRSQLKADDIFPLIWYKVYSRKQNRWIVIRPPDICYAFCGFKDGRKKIYRPFGKKEIKWLNNCNKDDIIKCNSNLISEQLIITKSYKDTRILTNLGIKSIGFQSENVIPSDEVLINEIKDYKKVIIFYDNDIAGYNGANKLYWRLAYLISAFLGHIELKVIHLPFCLNLKGIKDSADLYYSNKEELKNYMRLNGIKNV
jgi:5S rRNA maturation endonuclease (ribonuclease M5)